MIVWQVSDLPAGFPYMIEINDIYAVLMSKPCDPEIISQNQIIIFCCGNNADVGKTVGR
ncbi:hypothetical protein C4J93_0610 [Pseudomonas sp. R2-37-08W]|nr:hypothetical protein C4J93_0610 [Pseudomonas sp. R2-37-08W]AZF45868.1 hypothetical protein C4J86_0604 [Pseudomonas sp. R2-7-07]AZF56512.1 hypothetical protein C4J84_0607 [Pseudomonas sp. R11-23-07]